MKLEEIEIASLTLDPENERDHPADNLKDIKNSLKLFGQQTPITVNKANRVILKGNGTTLAAKELGWKKIWVHWTDLTEKKAKAYKIADNRSGEKAKWNKDLLSKSLDSLKEEFSLDELGFDESFFKPLEEEIKEKELDENIQTSNECPSCGYQW